MKANHVILYTPYDNPPPQIGQFNTEPSMTQQQFADECDINQILAKFIKTGFLDTVGPGFYDDVSDSLDYQMALDLVAQANDKFSDLTADLRKYFDNDPRRFMDFVHDPNNRDEAIKIGLIPAETTTYQPPTIAE